VAHAIVVALLESCPLGRALVVALLMLGGFRILAVTEAGIEAGREGSALVCALGIAVGRTGVGSVCDERGQK
jgi:hypothetical protein